MNNGPRTRPNTDVILNEHKKTDRPIGNITVARRFLEKLQAQSIPAALDDPFGHIPGYPCTELTQEAVAQHVPELLFDIPRHLLLANPDSKYSLTKFQPDPSRVQIFAATALDALQHGLKGQ
jgi:hypothetical protein